MNIRVKAVKPYDESKQGFNLPNKRPPKRTIKEQAKLGRLKIVKGRK